MSSPLYSALRTLEIVEARAADMQRRTPWVTTIEYDKLLSDLRSAMAQVVEFDESLGSVRSALETLTGWDGDPLTGQQIAQEALSLIARSK